MNSEHLFTRPHTEPRHYHSRWFSFKTRSQLRDALVFVAVLAMPWQARWIFFEARLQGEIFEYGKISIYLSSILLLVALAALFSFERPSVLRKIPLGAYFVWLVIGAVVAGNGALSLFYLSITLLGFGYYILVMLWGRYKSALAFVFSGILQTVVAWYFFIAQRVPASTLVGIAQHTPDAQGESVVIVAGARILRAYGILPHPNVLGGFLVIAFALLLYLFITHERDFSSHISWKRRGMYLAGLLLVFSGILITFSRSALFAAVLLVVAWLGYSFVYQKKYMKRVCIVSMSAMVIMFFAFNAAAGNIWWERFGVVASPQSVMHGQVRLEKISLVQRAAGYKEAWELLTPSALLAGYGIGNYVPELADAFPGRAVYEYQPVHNVYILMLLEIGLIGVVLLAWVLISRTLFAITHCRSVFDCRFMFSVIGVLAVIAFFDHFLWTSYFGHALCWFAVGLVAKND